MPPNKHHISSYLRGKELNKVAGFCVKKRNGRLLEKVGLPTLTYITLLLMTVAAGCSFDTDAIEKIPPNQTQEVELPSICGDGILNIKSEECDDGGVNNGDGCSSTCYIEKGWDCSSGRCKTPVCGDGIVAIGREECDDGNQGDGDGCSPGCRIEKGWDCHGFYGSAPEWLVFPQTFHVFSNPFTLDLNCIEKNSVQKHLYKPTQNPADMGRLLLIQESTCNTEERNAFNRWFSLQNRYDQYWTRAPFFVNLRQGTTSAGGSQQSETQRQALSQGSQAPYFPPKKAPPDFVTVDFKLYFQYVGQTHDLKYHAVNDLWVYINNKLALDGGGRHPYRELTVPFRHTTDPNTGKPENLDYNLEFGGIYEFAVYHNSRQEERWSYYKPKNDLRVNVPLVVVGPSVCYRK